MWTPRDFVDDTWDIGAPSTISDKGLWNVLNLCLDPINITSVLDALRVSLLAISHFSTLARSSFKTVLIFRILLLAKVKCVSSAYIRGTEFNRQLGKSLIYIKKRSGPRIVPWGMPQVRKWSPEREPFTKHRCLRQSKYDLNHSYEVPWTPYLFNLDKRISWSTVSKAFFKSKKTTAFTLPWSML